MPRSPNGAVSARIGERPPASAHVPASSRVYEELRSRIVSLEWPPGAILPRAELAAAFGVSQSPVREAIQRLEQADLVVSYRQSRTEVTKIDPARLRQEQFFRAGLECEAVFRLAEAGDDAALLKVRGVLKIQQALADDLSQIELFRQLDESFHRELFIAAGQEALHELVADRTCQMARLRALDLPRPDKMRAVIEGHAAILAAIETGDGCKAAAAMRRHLSGTIGRLPEILAERPDYFVG